MYKYTWVTTQRFHQQISVYVCQGNAYFIDICSSVYIHITQTIPQQSAWSLVFNVTSANYVKAGSTSVAGALIATLGDTKCNLPLGMNWVPKCEGFLMWLENTKNFAFFYSRLLIWAKLIHIISETISL